MKIVHIIPGSGGTFYCQNCMRDNELLRALMAKGHDVKMVPMYLPLNFNVNGFIADTPVFYGAINIFLKEKLPFYRHVPQWLERFFDSQMLLRYAAKKSGSTRPAGLEEMTISVLLGEEGRQSSELDHLIKYLKREGKPDVVHLSNALLLGLARRLKNDLNTVIVCTLQDENEWIDPMDSAYQEKVWDTMRERAKDVDVFIAPSRYFAQKSQRQLQIPAEKMNVVYDGINFQGYEVSPLPFDPPAIGFLCRMSEYYGLGILVDAYLALRQDSQFKNLRLHLTGGYSKDDKPFVNRMLKKLAAHRCSEEVTIFEKFDKKSRVQFLKSLTLLSVPVPHGEAFGAYQVEALAAGVPIVEPNIGVYPEFVEITGGGIVYEPNDSEHLAEALSSLLKDHSRVCRIGEQGRKSVMERFSIHTMADNIITIYRDTLNQSQMKQTSQFS
ncbi:MAG: glycosyltransferase family 4 protein [bacterium]